MALDQQERNAIRNELGRITGWPWFWHGNTDSHTVALAGREPGLGVCQVLTTVSVPRDPAGDEAAQLRSDVMDSFDMDETAADQAISEWASDPYSGEARADQRLALSDEHHTLVSAEDVAVFTVARGQGLPDDTPRNSPKVYRADVCDVRNINGQFIAAAPRRIAELLDTIEELEARVSELEAAPRGSGRWTVPGGPR